MTTKRPRKPLPPELVAQWSSRNEIDVSAVSAGSGKKVWWVCEEGHEWDAAPYLRAKGRGCPYCSGRYAIPGLNDLATTNPGIVKYWHPSKNLDKTPNTILPKSSQEAWWLGDCGHEWKSPVCRFLNGSRCPYCSGKRVLQGFNDLAHNFPELVKEWSPKNSTSPDKIHYSSRSKRLWICRYGHTWNASVANRTRKNYGCPYCAGRMVLEGFNDLATTHPELLSEWSLNNPISPRSVSYGSGSSVLWICPKGHEYVARISHRTYSKSSCPSCVDVYNPSVVDSIIRAVNADLSNEKIDGILWPSGHVFEVDVLLHPKVVIEYDGNRWHLGKEDVDCYKTKTLLDAGYKVIRIRQHPLPLLDLEHPNLVQLSERWTLDVDYWRERLTPFLD